MSTREGTPSIVEIGRCRGGTTLLAAAGGEVVSLDIDERVSETDKSLMRVLSRIGLQGKVALHISDSSTFPVEGGSVDVLFVDGDHTYDGISRDVAHWFPALRDGGIVLFHDARHRRGARRAWKPSRRTARRPGWSELIEGFVQAFRARGDASTRHARPVSVPQRSRRRPAPRIAQSLTGWDNMRAGRPVQRRIAARLTASRPSTTVVRKD